MSNEHFPKMITFALLALLVCGSTGQISSDNSPEGGKGEGFFVDTNLSLSPWELYVLTELALKLTSFQCPGINYVVTDSMTKELSGAFQNAPRTESQNVEFLPAYSRLTQCLGYLEEKKDGSLTQSRKNEIEKAENLQEVASVEKSSSEADWAPVEPPKLSSAAELEKMFVPNVSQDGFLPKIALSIQTAVTKVLETIFSPFFPKVDQEKIQANEEKFQAQMADKIAHDRRLELSFKKATQNYANFFHEVSKLIQRVCPKIHRPDKTFTRNALLDVTIWATHDKHEAILTATRYFQNHKLITKIMECNLRKRN